jgi:hypothetical protein
MSQDFWINATLIAIIVGIVAAFWKKPPTRTNTVDDDGVVWYYVM